MGDPLHFHELRVEGDALKRGPAICGCVDSRAPHSTSGPASSCTWTIGTPRGAVDWNHEVRDAGMEPWMRGCSHCMGHGD